eukprot:gene166-biopygen11149
MVSNMENPMNPGNPQAHSAALTVATARWPVVFGIRWRTPPRSVRRETRREANQQKLTGQIQGAGQFLRLVTVPEDAALDAMAYQAARDLVSDSWQMNMGNRRNSGNCNTYIGTNGADISMRIRGDPMKTEACPGRRRVNSGRPFLGQQGCGGPGLVQSSSDPQFRTGAYSVPMITRVAATSNPSSEVTSCKLGKGSHSGVIHFDKGAITARRRFQCRKTRTQ